jgi:hypothetical protein
MAIIHVDVIVRRVIVIVRRVIVIVRRVIVIAFGRTDRGFVTRFIVAAVEHTIVGRHDRLKSWVRRARRSRG